MKHATGSAVKAKARGRYPGLSIHFARESGKMAERFSRPQTLSSDNIAGIVRRVIGAFGNLPSNPSNESGSASSRGSGAGPSYVDTQHELHDRFRIPRASTASSSGPGKVPTRARSSSRFVPYTRGKANSKQLSPNNHIYG